MSCTSMKQGPALPTSLSDWSGCEAAESPTKVKGLSQQLLITQMNDKLSCHIQFGGLHVSWNDSIPALQVKP